jgi:hypothetical protein
MTRPNALRSAAFLVVIYPAVGVFIADTVGYAVFARAPVR